MRVVEVLPFVPSTWIVSKRSAASPARSSSAASGPGRSASRTAPASAGGASACSASASARPHAIALRPAAHQRQQLRGVAASGCRACGPISAARGAPRPLSNVISSGAGPLRRLAQEASQARAVLRGQGAPALAQHHGGLQQQQPRQALHRDRPWTSSQPRSVATMPRPRAQPRGRRLERTAQADSSRSGSPRRLRAPLRSRASA